MSAHAAWLRLISGARHALLTDATSVCLPKAAALPPPNIGNGLGGRWSRVLGCRAGASLALAQWRTRGKVVRDAFAPHAGRMAERDTRTL
jgi:hypothetical protein